MNHENVAKFDNIYQRKQKLILQRPHRKWDLKEFIRSHKVEHRVENSLLKEQRNFKPLYGLPLPVLKNILR